MSPCIFPPDSQPVLPRTYATPLQFVSAAGKPYTKAEGGNKVHQPSPGNRKVVLHGSQVGKSVNEVRLSPRQSAAQDCSPLENALPPPFTFSASAVPSPVPRSVFQSHDRSVGRQPTSSE